MLDVDEIVKLALKEDMPGGDITTDTLLPIHTLGRASVQAKEDLVLSGTDVFNKTFRALSTDIQIQWLKNDSDFVLRGQTICTLAGPLPALLKGERVALNFLGRLSGIASLTRCFVEEVKHTATRILDTRKTTPLLRQLERTAVRHGGGTNHRMNLSDKVLIKENHIAACKSIQTAIETIRQKTGKPIEIEVRSLEELKMAIPARPEIIMLDNMSNEEIADALKMIPASIQVEASGNMKIERVRSVAELGVHFISVGSLTHSAPCADISMVVRSHA